jgi:putative NADH-flavin reductase
MKIAITGHSAGIGAAFASELSQRGHEIVGLSRRTGYNIRSVPKVAKQILDCDFFISNAQAGYAQTELLYEVWQNWYGQEKKWIWVIGTMMTQSPKIPDIPGLEKRHIMEYKNQKQALETACENLRSQKSWPHITVIRPGGVATQPGQQPEFPYAEPNNWAKSVIDLILLATSRGLNLQEISLGCARHRIVL